MYRIVGICWLLSVLLCGGTLIISHAQPVLSVIPEIQECGDLLCFLDIQAGTTPLDDGNAILRRTSKLPQDNVAGVGVWRIQRNSKPYLGLWLTSNGISDVVGMVHIVFDAADLSAGDIVARFGIPCVTVSRVNYIQLAYPMGLFRFSTRENNKLRPDAQLVEVSLYDSVTSKTACVTNPPYKESDYYWRGFNYYFESIQPFNRIPVR